MNMKVKKIRNVEKSICCCEQKIAYNYAFRYEDILKRIYKSDNITIVKSDAIWEVIQLVEDGIKRNGIDKKYNIDAIIHAFRNGIEKYANGYTILTSYKEIGETFPILYDIE